MSDRFLTLTALLATLAAALAHAQPTPLWTASQGGPVYTQRWTEAQGGPVYTERWSEKPGGSPTRRLESEADELNRQMDEAARNVGDFAGYMDHCGLDTSALRTAFDRMLNKTSASSGERNRRLALHDAARAAARQQAVASGKVRQGACPADVLQQIRAAHGQVIDSLEQITAGWDVARTQVAATAPSAGVAETAFAFLPLADVRKTPGVVEIRSDCHKWFASRSGPQVDIRWFGITKKVTLIGRRPDGDLCAVYDDGSSEWIAANRVMSAEEKKAHDKEMQAFGAGLSHPLAGTGGTVQDMMDKLRATGNALHQQTQEQYRQTEQYYENRRRYGQ